MHVNDYLLLIDKRPKYHLHDGRMHTRKPAEVVTAKNISGKHRARGTPAFPDINIAAHIL